MFSTLQKVHLLIGSGQTNKKQLAETLNIVRLTLDRRLEKDNFKKLEAEKIDQLFEKYYAKK
jgi:hypothetical protein